MSPLRCQIRLLTLTTAIAALLVTGCFFGGSVQASCGSYVLSRGVKADSATKAVYLLSDDRSMAVEHPHEWMGLSLVSPSHRLAVPHHSLPQPCSGPGCRRGPHSDVPPIAPQVTTSNSVDLLLSMLGRPQIAVQCTGRTTPPSEPIPLSGFPELIEVPPENA